MQWIRVPSHMLQGQENLNRKQKKYYNNFNKDFKRKIHIKNKWNSLQVQCLRLCSSTSGGPGSIPHQGTRIPQAVPPSQKQTNKQNLTNSLFSCLTIWLKGKNNFVRYLELANSEGQKVYRLPGTGRKSEGGVIFNIYSFCLAWLKSSQNWNGY